MEAEQVQPDFEEPYWRKETKTIKFDYKKKKWEKPK